MESSQYGHHLTCNASLREIVRVSTLENQQYKLLGAVTQMSLNENKRSMTLSTSKVLGATGSLKLVLERKDNETDENSESTGQSCEVTAILSIIPYKMFVKLLGIMCCICLMKWRAKMAMDCDLEDLKQTCEVRAKQRRVRAKQEGIDEQSTTESDSLQMR